MTLLSVEDLRIAFPAPGGAVHPVDGVSFTVDRGETLALVGESGCGKSLTALALLQLVPPPGRVVGGRVRLGEVDVTALRGEALRAVRGRRIGMVFQDPLTSLNPVLRVGDQVAEGLVAHGMAQGVAARRRAVELLRRRRGARRRLPAPAERRDAPAGGDRHRAGGGAGAPRRR